MNETRADDGLAGLKPQPGRRSEGWPAEPKPRGEGWPWQRWLIFVALVLAAQLALIFSLGEKQFPPPRAAANVPQLTLADSSDELIALDDPTLFVLPHANDFVSAVWNRMPVASQPSFRWTEPPRPLPLAAGNLGAVFARFMQTNQFARFEVAFKPPAKLSEPALPIPPVFAENSALHIEGGLAQRRWLNPVSLTNWAYPDVIAPSKVQMLVDAAGDVVSAVLLPPDNPSEAASHYDKADQRALELARSLRFAPAPDLTVGRLIFDWITVPPPATNSPAAGP